MKNYRNLIIYGVVMGLVFFLMEALNYKTRLKEVSLELYGMLVGVVFLILGIWLGINIVQRRQAKKSRKKPSTSNLSEREYEVLNLMADGQSNQEIADQLFVSLNTVKTHISNIFAKLDVQRRTQAIQKARELNLI